MDETVSAAEANRQFSAILRAVREGASYTVTSHGRAVARIIPADVGSQTAARAREALFARLKNQAPIQSEPWTRDDLYDE